MAHIEVLHNYGTVRVSSFHKGVALYCESLMLPLECLAHLDMTSWDNRMVPQELQFKIS